MKNTGKNVYTTKQLIFAAFPLYYVIQLNAGVSILPPHPQRLMPLFAKGLHEYSAPISRRNLSKVTSRECDTEFKGSVLVKAGVLQQKDALC